MILSFESADRAAKLAEHPTFPSVVAEERLTPWEGFDRKLVYRSAYDGRHEPENYGIHCAELILILERDGRAIEGGVMTGWHMPHNERAVIDAEVKWQLKEPGRSSLHGLSRTETAPLWSEYTTGHRELERERRLRRREDANAAASA